MRGKGRRSLRFCVENALERAVLKAYNLTCGYFERQKGDAWKGPVCKAFQG